MANALLSVHVSIRVKAGREDALKAAAIRNARKSVQEKGCARFDVLQEIGDPASFKLIEVYRSLDAVAAHKETKHYESWRDATADWVIEKTTTTYTPIVPEAPGWAVPPWLSSDSSPNAAEEEEMALSVDAGFFVITPIFQAKPEHAAALREVLAENARSSRETEPGVLRFDLCEKVDDPTVLALTEVFVDQSAYEAHRQTAHYKKAVAALPDLLSENRGPAKRFRTVFPFPPDAWRGAAAGQCSRRAVST